MLWSIVLSFCATGVLADTVTLFNPNPGVPLSAYEAGVTDGLTTYLLGCDKGASATGSCNFTAPITLVEGTATYHVEITTPLPDGCIQTLTVDCPNGAAAGCSVTALNKEKTTTTVSLNATYFSAGLTACTSVPSAGAILYNGIPSPSAYPTVTYGSNITATHSHTPTATGAYTNVTTTKGVKGTTAVTSLPAQATKSGAVKQYLGAQAVFVVLVGACVVLLGW